MSAVTLRDYQLEALTAIEEARQRGINRQLLALPTGTGKTIVFAELIRRRQGRALVLVHRDELVRQAVAKLNAYGEQIKSVGVVKAEQNEVEAQVVVASAQTLCRPARLAQLAQEFMTVVVDEAHHATTTSYQTILEHVQSGSPDRESLLLGVTANL